MDGRLRQEGIEAHSPEVRALDRERSGAAGARQHAEPAAGGLPDAAVRVDAPRRTSGARFGLWTLSWPDRKSLERFNSAVMRRVCACVCV